MAGPDDIPEWAWSEAAALRGAINWQSNASNEAIARALLSAERRGIETERERCAKACEDQAQQFLSPEFAFPQPIGSLAERFACAECATAIRQLGASE